LGVLKRSQTDGSDRARTAGEHGALPRNGPTSERPYLGASNYRSALWPYQGAPWNSPQGAP
jgi:hypothetical protein